MTDFDMNITCLVTILYLTAWIYYRYDNSWQITLKGVNIVIVQELLTQLLSKSMNHCTFTPFFVVILSKVSNLIYNSDTFDIISGSATPKYVTLWVMCRSTVPYKMCFLGLATHCAFALFMTALIHSRVKSTQRKYILRYLHLQ